MRAPTRRVRTTVRLLCVAVALLGVTTWGWIGAGAEAQPSDAPTLRLVRQTDWVGPEAVFQVVVTATGLPAGATVGGALYPRVNDRATLDDAAAGRTSGSSIFTVRDRPVAEQTAADGTITVSLPVSTASSAPADVAWVASAGVYPFVVRVYDGQSIVTELVTTLLRLGPASPTVASGPLAVGVALDVAAPVVPALDGTPTLEADGAAHLTATATAVAARPSLPLTLVPSAESLQLLDDTGTDGAAAVDDLATRVAREVLTGPYAPIDTGAWMANGLVAELDGQYATGTATLQTLLGSRPTEGLAVLDPSVSPVALDHLHQLGVGAVVAPSGQLATLGNRSDDATFAQQFEIVTADGTAVRAVVGDETTAARLLDASDPVLAGHRALAELAFLHLADPGTARGVAVSVPSGVDLTALTTFLDGLTDTDGAASGSTGEIMVSPVTLDDLFTVTSTATEGTGDRATPVARDYDAAVPPDLGAYPTELRTTRSSYAGLVSLVPTGGALTTTIDRTLLSSGSRALDAGQRGAMLDAADRSISATAAEIVVAPEQIVTLTSSSGNVPLNLENRLPYEASVRLVLESAKLDFPEGSVIERTIPPAQTTTINLPVETRASGAFPLEVAITSADGALPVASTRYTVRSTAISGVGLVLSVGAGLFLLVWWARHFRTSRRARKLVGSNHPALSGTEPDEYAPPDTDPLEGR